MKKKKYQIIYLDETSFTTNIITNYGYSKKYETLRINKSF